MSFTLQTSNHRGAPWFPALLPISQWAPSPFSLSACPKCSAHSSFTSFLELLCCAGQGTRLTCAVPHPSLLPWHSSGWQHCRGSGFMGCDCRISDACQSPLKPAAARIPHINKAQWQLPRGSPCRSGDGRCLAKWESKHCQGNLAEGWLCVRIKSLVKIDKIPPKRKHLNALLGSPPQDRHPGWCPNTAPHSPAEQVESLTKRNPAFWHPGAVRDQSTNQDKSMSLKSTELLAVHANPGCSTGRQSCAIWKTLSIKWDFREVYNRNTLGAKLTKTRVPNIKNWHRKPEKDKNRQKKKGKKPQLEMPEWS